MAGWLGLAACLVAGTAAIDLGRRWRAGRVPRPALLGWALGLGLWAVSGLALGLGAWRGFSSPMVRILYLCSAALALPWLAWGSVAHHAVDRVTSRLTSVALLAVVVSNLADVLALRRTAVLMAVLATAWLLLLADGQRQRLVAGGLLVTLGWSAVAIVTILPSPVRALASSGLPAMTDVLPEHVLAFGRAAIVVAGEIVVIGALLALGSAILRHADDDRRPWTVAAMTSGWRNLVRSSARAPALAGLVVAVGVLVVLFVPTLVSGAGHAAMTAIALGVASVVVHDGGLRAVGQRGVPDGAGDATAGDAERVTRVWD